MHELVQLFTKDLYELTSPPLHFPRLQFYFTGNQHSINTTTSVYLLKKIKPFSPNNMGYPNNHSNFLYKKVMLQRELGTATLYHYNQPMVACLLLFDRR